MTLQRGSLLQSNFSNKLSSLEGGFNLTVIIRYGPSRVYTVYQPRSLGTINIFFLEHLFYATYIGEQGT